MNKKLICSTISLMFAILLCVVTCYAWFLEVNSSKTGEIILKSKDIDVSVDLFLLNSNNDTYEDISENNSLNIGVLMPGDIKYFKMVVSSNSSSSINIDADFEGITSSLQSRVQYDEEANEVFVLDFLGNKLPLYDVEDNLVKVNNQNLYTVSNGIVSLDTAYNIDQVISLYNFGATDTRSIDGYTAETLNDSLISNVIIGPQGTGEGVYTLYFALELNQDLMGDYSNCYQYQQLLIDHIVITIS